jgi:hypothetical protein
LSVELDTAEEKLFPPDYEENKNDLTKLEVIESENNFIKPKNS